MNEGARMYFAGDREDDDLLAGPSRGSFSLRPSRCRPGLLQMIVALHWRHHQEAVAFRDDALAIAGFHVRVADDDIVLLAGVDDALHPFQHDFVLVLARIAEFLRKIAFA